MVRSYIGLGNALIQAIAGTGVDLPERLRSLSIGQEAVGRSITLMKRPTLTIDQPAPAQSRRADLAPDTGFAPACPFSAVTFENADVATVRRRKPARCGRIRSCL